MPHWGIFPSRKRVRQEDKERQLRELLVKDGRFPPGRVDDLVGCAVYSWMDDAERDRWAKQTGVSRDEIEMRVNDGLRSMFQYRDIAELVIGDREKAAHAHLASLQWLLSLSHGQRDPDDS